MRSSPPRSRQSTVLLNPRRTSIPALSAGLIKMQNRTVSDHNDYKPQHPEDRTMASLEFLPDETRAPLPLLGTMRTTSLVIAGVGFDTENGSSGELSVRVITWPRRQSSSATEEQTNRNGHLSKREWNMQQSTERSRGTVNISPLNAFAISIPSSS